MRELDYWPDARFLTLTYSDEFLPSNGSLKPEDLTLFNKRLRKDLGDRKIKFYACGEYGEIHGRPHYHGIYYGLTRLDFDLVEKCWGMGRVHLGTVTSKSINYVTAYITKKLWGDVGKEVYGEKLFPFSRMSKGLGLQWCMDNKIQLLADLGLRRQGKIVPMPRYYYNKIESDIPDQLREELIRLRADKVESDLDAAGKTIYELAKIRVDQRIQTRRNLEARRAISDNKRGISLKRQ